MRIWKYVIPLQQEAYICDSHEGALWFSAQIQGGDICAWVAIDTARPRINYSFQIVPTGYDFDVEEVGDYLGTVQQGSLVWHVFVKECSNANH